MRKYNLAAGAIIGLSGLTLIIIGLGWLPALGLFLAMWGNNMQFCDRS